MRRRTGKRCRGWSCFCDGGFCGQPPVSLDECRALTAAEDTAASEDDGCDHDVGMGDETTLADETADFVVATQRYARDVVAALPPVDPEADRWVDEAMAQRRSCTSRPITKRVPGPRFDDFER